MRLHHLALKTADVAGIAGWYEALFGLPRLREQADERGLRSVWLGLDGAILMVERAESGAARGEAGWHGVYLAVPPGSGMMWEARLRAAGAEPERRTAATLYAQDPDGNWLGLSAYPDVLFF